MAADLVPFARRTTSALSRSVADKRRHKRCRLSLIGRFMRENKDEHDCQLADISVGGAGIIASVLPDENERIIIYFDQLGGIEATVIRHFDGGFAVRIRASAHKREKLAAQIMWLVNRGELDGAEERQHERIPANEKTSVLQFADGAETRCSILDVSVSGASLGTDVRPPIGAEIMLGRLRARVMRHHAHGVGVQFLRVQEADTLRRDIA